MTVLLDAHAFLWFIAGNPKLSNAARTFIEEQTQTRLLSVASLWEIAIKHSLGRLTLAAPFNQIIPPQLNANGIGLLGIEVEHLNALVTLPFHHRDPFDRLLIAEAIVGRISIVSADVAFDAYPVTRLW
jgi:PIN domain nuclease of toxin-antitoxin system